VEEETLPSWFGSALAFQPGEAPPALLDVIKLTALKVSVNE
jgi:hypothetical protein